MVKKLILNNKELILIIPYLLIGFTPYFGSIDKIAPQFLFLSVYNILLFGYSLFYHFRKGKLTELYENPIFIIFGLFTLWSSFSFIYAQNKVEVAIEIARLLIYSVASINIFSLIKRINHNNRTTLILILISCVLFAEITFVLSAFIQRFDYSNYTRDTGLRTFTGNINIAAFSILLKIPVLIYLFNKLKSNFRVKIISTATFGITFFTLFLLGSRGANLGLFIILFISIIFIYVKQKRISKPLVLIVSFSIATITNSLLLENSNLKVIERSVNLDTSSTRQRLDFWQDALTSIKENPILGIGLGNWKINSIKHYSKKMSEYTVPYHAHNDFLQVTAEVGVIGFIIFYVGFFYFFLIRYKTLKKIASEKSTIVFFLSACILIFLLDSFLNFPLARPIIYIQFLIIISLLSTNIITKSNSNKLYQKFTYLLSIILFSLSIAAFAASYKVFNSYKEQNFLIQASRGKITNYSVDFVKNTESEFPNISATTVPLETMKANLLFEKGIKEDTILKMIESGDKNNPYLHIGDALKAIFYIDKNKTDTTYLDSAYASIKKAYYGLPNNKFHRDIFYDIIEFKKDTLELTKAYSYLENPSLEASKKYFQVYNKIYDSVGQDKIRLVENKLASFPEDKYLNTLRKSFKVGKRNVEKGVLASIEAKVLFEQEKFKEAAVKYEEAFSYNDMEIAYFENAANAYMQIGENDKGIQILEEMIVKLEPNTGKAEYLLGIMYVDKKEYKKGCDYFGISKRKGFSISKEITDYFCASEKIKSN